MVGRLGVVLGLVVLAAGPAAAADETVDAGPLRASIAGDPFRLTFVDARGRAVLGGGQLRVGGARVLRASGLRRVGRAVTGTLVTRAGHRIALRVAPAATGVVSLRASGADVRAVEASFAAARRELFTGFGERSNAVDFNGLDVLDYVADGPFRPHDRAVLSALAPPWSGKSRDDDTYYPVPWLLSSRGYGVLAANDETSRFDLGRVRRGRWSVEVESGLLSLRVFAGPRPADALRRFTALTGRQPASAAPWVYGPWFQTGQPNVIPLDEEARITRILRDADAPASAMETQMHFLPCGAQRGLESYERRRTRQAHEAGLAQLAYFNPHLCDSYQPLFGDAAAAGLLQRTAVTGRPFSFPSFVGGGGGSAGFSVEPLAQFDFTAPGIEAFYGRLVREAFEQGKDGWMEDFGEYTPPFVSSADGTPGERIHNRYPRDYHCTVHRIARRLGRPVTRHQRSGWTGAARCASIVWGGDPATVWGYDGLRTAVTQALTIGMSGVARWGTDIGGYTTLGTEERLTRELLNRWIELGAVSAVMRTKRSGIAIPAYERPQVFDRASLPIWRRYTKLHTQLYPYLRAADAVYRSTGLPIMRHGLLTRPDDERAVRAHDQFMFGPDLAAPLTGRGARRRRLYAPAGAWVDWWRSVAFRRRDGAFIPGRPRLLSGRRRHTLPAPENELPLLVRAGAVLPLLPADVDTLSPYGRRGVVQLADRAGRLTLLAFPRGRWRGRFGERGRLQAREGRAGWELTIASGHPRTYTLRAALGSLRRRFRPKRITVDGGPLARSRWSCNRRTSVLTARFTAAGRATVRVTGPG